MFSLLLGFLLFFDIEIQEFREIKNVICITILNIIYICGITFKNNKMKTNKAKKEIKKFDLEKLQFAKLKNMRLIIGGKQDPDTGTATSNRCDRKKLD